MDKEQTLHDKRVEGGRKGGRATGPQKSWILKLTPEERSKHMSAVRRKAFKKQEGSHDSK